MPPPHWGASRRMSTRRLRLRAFEGNRSRPGVRYSSIFDRSRVVWERGLLSIGLSLKLSFSTFKHPPARCEGVRVSVCGRKHVYTCPAATGVACGCVRGLQWRVHFETPPKSGLVIRRACRRRQGAAKLGNSCPLPRVYSCKPPLTAAVPTEGRSDPSAAFSRVRVSLMACVKLDTTRG